jgi:uncharacterized integral membrane protein (TIGR00697 family)
MKQKLKNFFTFDKPISVLQVILTVLFVGALLVSNIISARLFNLFGFGMTCAVVVFPITYILSDLFSEVYGYKWSRLTCYLGFTINLFAVGVFYLASCLPAVIPSQEQAFNSILVGTFSCTMASFIAFVVGDFVNDKIFAKMKKQHDGLTNHKGFALRAIISSFAGELIDSCIYLPLAFLVFNPIMTVGEVLTMIVLQVTLKTAYEAIILPLTTFLTKKVSSYEYSLLERAKQNELV